MTKEVPGGYHGKILSVNLSNNSVSTETIDGIFCRKYLGGSGFISYFLLEELGRGVDSLGPENKLIFALGPMVGTSVIGNGRNAIGAKSPLSGGIAFSQVGESWGAELKKAGCDAIIVEGKADKPVYLWINDGEVKIRDAGHLWGKNTKETQETIRSELDDDKIRVAQIGPAGENIVRYACIMNGLFDTAGRGGLGAVMGSKKLKAIAVRGRKALQISNPEGVRDFNKWVRDNLTNHWLGIELIEYGTGGPQMEVFEEMGNLPVRKRIAERTLTMARLFNIREEFTAEDDALPLRYFQPKTDGALADKALDPDKMDKAKRYYYALMGWDKNGVPLPEKVDELSIEYEC